MFPVKFLLRSVVLVPARRESEGTYSVVNASDLSLHAPGMTAKTSTEAYAMHDALVAADPSLQGKVLVAASHELS